MSTRVLWVHDGADQLQAIKHNLQRAGYEVLSACDGSEALHLLATEQVDGVVLKSQVDAPGGTSLRFQIQRISPDVPCLMYSGESEVGSLPLSVFRAYLDDPAPPVNLLRSIPKTNA